MLRKLIILVTMVIAFVTTGSALNIHYRGFADIQCGAFFASYGQPRILLGTSTTHGIQLIDGLFIGGGLNINVGYYRDPEFSDDPWFEDGDDIISTYSVTVYAAGRYEFLHNRKVSPYVDMRIGGGYLDESDGRSLYLSPSAGVTVNFTERFGLDISLAYSLWTADYFDDHYNGLAIKVGLHF